VVGILMRLSPRMRSWQIWAMSKVRAIDMISRTRSMILTETELKRSFSLLGMIGFAFSIVTR
jgi:hypothetical protein